MIDDGRIDTFDSPTAHLLVVLMVHQQHLMVDQQVVGPGVGRCHFGTLIVVFLFLSVEIFEHMLC